MWTEQKKITQRKYNKDFIEKHRTELKLKIICKCGGSISKWNYYRHIHASKKHAKYIDNEKNKEIENIRKLSTIG